MAGEWKNGWFVVPHDVLFSDLDLFGHVNNAVFLTYFELGRTQLWFDLMDTRDPRDIAFIVARAEVDFRQQIAMERIEIATRIAKLGTTSMEFIAEIRNARDEVAANGRVVVVLYDWARRSKVAVSEGLRRKVEAHARSDSSGSGTAAIS